MSGTTVIVVSMTTTDTPTDVPQAFEGSRIDHLNMTVSDMASARPFYEKALGAAGIAKLLDFAFDPETGRPAMVGFGIHPKPFFWLVEGAAVDPQLHVAFTVRTRDAVDAFHEAALAAGATSKLAPGVRPEYHPDYYGGFVLAPDGLNLEVVCHTPD